MVVGGEALPIARATTVGHPIYYHRVLLFFGPYWFISCILSENDFYRRLD